jgi:hypothetical protein
MPAIAPMAIRVKYATHPDDLATVCSAHLTTVGDIPLIVLSHGQTQRLPGLSEEAKRELEQTWQQIQVKLVQNHRMERESSQRRGPNKLTNGRCPAINGQGVSFWRHTGDKGHMTEKQMQPKL